MMYFGILRDVEWRLLMGLEVSANDAEITDYINYSVDLFLKVHLGPSTFINELLVGKIKQGICNEAFLHF